VRSVQCQLIQGLRICTAHIIHPGFSYAERRSGARWTHSRHCTC
jgi:hypothetical protein